MKTIKRAKPASDDEHNYKIKTFSYNEQGMFFIIYTDLECKKEKLIGLNDNEARRLFNFIRDKIK